MLLSRTRFFLLLFGLLAGPLLVPRLLWMAGSRHTTGTMAFVGHDGIGSTLGITTYPVIFFQLGKDSVFFNGLNGYGYKPGDPVPVRYSVSDPEDARIDRPVSIWGQTGVNLLCPVLIWLVIILTPARFDPLIPRHCKLLIQWKKPYIKVIPAVF
ncbi:MAG TPA: DUF3592 domain-containing protein [Puia sp.]|jgi:hypothetical protein